MEKRVAVALSGGVDSLCALLSLKESGYNVFALHGHFLDSDQALSFPLRKICADLSIVFHSVDLRGEFSSKVITPFLRAWSAGQTPNPCVLCNREIKFGLLWEQASRLGADALATGHYVRLYRHQARGTTLLGSAKDREKDQAYFLSLLPPKTLQHAIFPLSDYTKAECRELVRKAHIEPPSTAESQDICFLPRGEKCGDFVRERIAGEQGDLDQSGPILVRRRNSIGQLEELPVGSHNGLCGYTIGQRKGLGIAYSEPLYVLEKNRKTNTLILASREELALEACIISKPNIFLPPEYWPDTLYSRMRYRQKAVPVTVKMGEGIFCIKPSQRVFSGAEGQLATIEDVDGNILAGGLISKIHFRA